MKQEDVKLITWQRQAWRTKWIEVYLKYIYPYDNEVNLFSKSWQCLIHCERKESDKVKQILEMYSSCPWTARHGRYAEPMYWYYNSRRNHERKSVVIARFQEIVTQKRKEMQSDLFFSGKRVLLDESLRNVSITLAIAKRLLRSIIVRCCSRACWRLIFISVFFFFALFCLQKDTKRFDPSSNYNVTLIVSVFQDLAQKLWRQTNIMGFKTVVNLLWIKSNNNINNNKF